MLTNTTAAAAARIRLRWLNIVFSSLGWIELVGLSAAGAYTDLQTVEPTKALFRSRQLEKRRSHGPAIAFSVASKPPVERTLKVSYVIVY